MSASDDLLSCARCGRDAPQEELDDAGWCRSCRAALVRQASRWAYAAAAATALLAAVLIWLVVGSARFLIFWLLLVGIVAFLAFKVARRVAFELLRTRTAALPG